ncbi:hypothetical protein [Roseibium aggregatum]|uniref:Uncharacterized protein n=1 Tax=Roseibium aggregatum TaxID=187304 RepID=A0A0M6Y7L6_9HYPH|nr:hypothetical protein [Roseibium aggregatum]CTQ45704.1 hypothetical protein LAL4801_04159 [Roseibium aggregatum]
MEAFIYALAATAIGGMTVLGYKQPKHFHRIAPFILMATLSYILAISISRMGFEEGLKAAHKIYEVKGEFSEEPFDSFYNKHISQIGTICLFVFPYTFIVWFFPEIFDLKEDEKQGK